MMRRKWSYVTASDVLKATCSLCALLLWYLLERRDQCRGICLQRLFNVIMQDLRIHPCINIGTILHAC